MAPTKLKPVLAAGYVVGGEGDPRKDFLSEELKQRALKWGEYSSYPYVFVAQVGVRKNDDKIFGVFASRFPALALGRSMMLCQWEANLDEMPVCPDEMPGQDEDSILQLIHDMRASQGLLRDETVSEWADRLQLQYNSLCEQFKDIYELTVDTFPAISDHFGEFEAIVEVEDE